MTFALKTQKAYWKLLKGAANISQSKLSSDNFACYFKAVNYPESVFYTPYEDVLYFNERYVKGEIQVMFSELDEPMGNLQGLIGSLMIFCPWKTCFITIFAHVIQ